MEEKKYRIITYWCRADCGYRYRYSIMNSKGIEVQRSEVAFWYEENARKAAEQEIEKL